MLRNLLFVACGLFFFFLLRMLLRGGGLSIAQVAQGRRGNSSRPGRYGSLFSLFTERMEARESSEDKSGSDDDVLQYVPMGSAKEEPIHSKEEAVSAPESDDRVTEILTRIEGLQKKILFQLSLVSLLALGLIVCVLLYFYSEYQ